jgi:hypothetical protein
VVPLQLITVQRLSAIGTGGKCRTGLVHIHLFENVRARGRYSG